MTIFILYSGKRSDQGIGKLEILSMMLCILKQQGHHMLIFSHMIIDQGAGPAGGLHDGRKLPLRAYQRLHHMSKFGQQTCIDRFNKEGQPGQGSVVCIGCMKTCLSINMNQPYILCYFFYECARMMNEIGEP